MIMQRTAMQFLKDWLLDSRRKPLIIRGARQVGKTWLVRQLAHENGLQLIELNFEKLSRIESIFESNDPRDILLRISSFLDIEAINPHKSLLFFDEIQTFPAVLAKLRWFAEDMPELPVISAGSLLEFVLEKTEFSMPVGRISYMYLEPLSFEEFLLAHKSTGLLEFIKSYNWGTPVPRAIHEKIMGLFKEYIIVGGMPVAVLSWTEKRSLQAVQFIHSDLITSYRDDFARYGTRIDKNILDDVMQEVPKKLGQKFMYSKVNPSASGTTIKKALDLLCMARICAKVEGTDANGVPLGAEVQDRQLKVIFLDVGLCSSALRLSLDHIISINEIYLINSGGIAEQVAGQLLRTIEPFYRDPALYYWHRESGSSAEIDYVIQHHNAVVPLEIKAGTTGKLRSLHVFMGLKKLSLAVRVNSDVPQKSLVKTHDLLGKPVEYDLLSLPFYLLGELHRLLAP